MKCGDHEFRGLKPQNGYKHFLKSTFLANFHVISIFENQNTVTSFIFTGFYVYLPHCVHTYHLI